MLRLGSAVRWAGACALLALSALGCSAGAAKPVLPMPPPGAPTFELADVAPAVGLAELGWRTRLRDARIIATVGGAAAWGDYDGDGDPDLYVTQGVSDRYQPQSAANCGKLLRNDGDTFHDVTAAAGLTPCGWGMGVLFEDLDEDGNLDLFLTYLGHNQLWRNRGDGRFEERSGALASSGWSTGAAAVDADHDGDLDLFVGRYLDTTPEHERNLPTFDLVPIESYEPQTDTLFRNHGGLEFVAAALPEMPHGRTLGVIAADLDLDGLADLYVANDRNRNTLLQSVAATASSETSSLVDVTDVAGVGLGPSGEVRSGMGVATGDVDRDGLPDLVVTNFAREGAGLFRNQGALTFVDEARATGLHDLTLPWLGWSTGLDDLDDDGHLDLWIAQAHLLPGWVPRMARLFGPRSRRASIAGNFSGPYAQPVQLLRNQDGRFVPGVESPPVGVHRGAAAADVDLDGRTDLFFYSSDPGTPSRLLRNRTPGAGHWLGLVARLPGAPPPHPGWRATVTAGERALELQWTSGGSFLGGSAVPLHAGLGAVERVDVELRRPGRRAVRWPDLPADHRYALPPTAADAAVNAAAPAD